MVEGDPLEVELAPSPSSASWPQVIGVAIFVPLQASEFGRLAQVGHDHDPLEARDLAGDLGHGVQAVEVLAAVAVAVDGEKDLRLDLGEAVDDAAGAEVRGAARPDGAKGR